MLTVHLPPGADAANRYAMDVLLGEFLGVPYAYGDAGVPGQVQVAGEGRVLSIADVFLADARQHWLQPGSLPDAVVCDWFYGNELPGLVLSGDTLPCRFLAPGDGPVLRFADDGAHCRLDIPGTVFCLLTRYEEAVCRARDAHGRVPLAALGRFQREHLQRPLADECVEVLYAAMQRLWPRLPRRERNFRVVPSHDVDRPFEYLFRSPLRMALRAGADLLLRRDAALALQNLRTWSRVRSGDIAADPCKTFGWLMDEAEQRGLRASFYFICARPSGRIDGDYDFAHPAIQALLRDIVARGHEAGIHGSYLSAVDGDQLAREAGILRGALTAAGAGNREIGGRQHFLRWQVPDGIVACERAGLAHDATLGFAEQPGFRCGTCHEHPAFDLRARRPLAVRERPLVAMDVSVTDPLYSGLGYTDAAREVFVRLKQTCRHYGGDFTLLWHNSRLATDAQRRLYTEVLDA